MPKWGLTAAMRATKPWCLDEEWLRPGKVITDPVHGDIHLTDLEMRIVDSPPFQRLRRVRQLGTTHLVYPGATHTRFAHSIGAVKVAQDLVDIIVDQRSGRDVPEDFFSQWERELKLSPGILGEPPDARARVELDKRVAEITVLARLGALLHDLCHVPFGHSIEDDLGILMAHDANVERFDRLWSYLPDTVRTTVAQADRLEAEVRRLVLSKAEHEGTSTYPFVADIVGNTICADLLDYLRRDHLYTGLPLALGRRFEAGFYVMPDGDPLYQRRLVLKIHRRGAERIDAVTEILKHLRYRYELSERALVHHTKLAADAMVGKALEMWSDALWAETAADRVHGTEAEAPSLPADQELDSLDSLLEPGSADSKAVTCSVRRELDEAMSQRGDDGLLEYLIDLPRAQAATHHRDEHRRQAVSSLARAVQERALFKRIAVQRHTREGPEKFYEKHGSPSDRRRVERTAALFGEVRPAWHVLVWLPSPKMKLKVAGVLVDDGSEIRPFSSREEDGKRRGADIYEAHRNLWEVSIFAHPDVAQDPAKRDRVLASLAADLNIHLTLEEPVEGAPHEWPDRLALRQLETQVNQAFDESQTTHLLEKHRAVAHRGADTPRPPFASLVAEYRHLLD